MTFAELAAILRLARRTAFREWKRTTLIVLLVAVSVGAAVVTAGVMRSGQVSDREWIIDQIGSADLTVEIRGHDPTVVQWALDAVASGDPDATVDVVVSYPAAVSDVYTTISDIDPTSPVAEGRTVLVSGAAPRQPGEVAMSRDVLERLGIGIGDTAPVSLEGGNAQDLLVTGVVQRPLFYRSDLVVVAPAQFDALVASSGGYPGLFPTTLLVSTDRGMGLAVDIEDSWATARWTFEPVGDEIPPELSHVPRDALIGLSATDLAALADKADLLTDSELLDLAYQLSDPYDYRAERADVYASSRDSLLAGMPDTYFYNSRFEQPQYIAALVAAALLAEVALVAGAAYATGTRRRLHELGLLGSSGATPRHIGAIVVSEGLVAGTIGAVLGVVAGGVVLLAAHGALQAFTDKLITGLPLQPVDAIAPALVGVAATVLAAWWPARAVSRVPVTAALQGRMPDRGAHGWTTVAGGTAIVLGSLFLLVGRSNTDKYRVMGGAGVVSMIAGATLLTGPLVAWLGKHADRLRATPRLMLRDAARQRTRAAAAISAVMVVVLGLVVVGVETARLEAVDAVQGLPEPGNQVLVMVGDHSDPYRYNTTQQDLDAVEAVLPPARDAILELLNAPVSLPTGLAEYLGDHRAAAIAEPGIGELLGEPAIDARLREGVPVVLGVARRTTTANVGSAHLDAEEYPVRLIRWDMPRVLIPAAVAERLNVDSLGTVGLIVAHHDLSKEERIAVLSSGYQINLADFSALTRRQALYAGAGGVLLVVLFVVALITSLSATESDRDLQLMTAVGAAPLMRRKFLGLQTAFYVFVAGLLALPLGWLIMKVARASNEFGNEGLFGRVDATYVPFPRMVAVIILVVMPVVVGTVTAVVVRSSPTTPPRTIG